MRRPFAGLVLFLLSLVLVALAVGSALGDSATDDEPAHIATGMVKVVHGRLDFFRNQPGLANSITALPLVAAGYEVPPMWSRTENPWPVGRALLYGAGADAPRILILARLPTIGFLIALSLSVYFFAAHYSGSRAWGIFAFILTGFCPIVMAHGRLATVDLAVTFFCFAAATLFLRLIERPSPAWAIAFGVTTTAALLTKTSANILGPYFVVVLAVALLARKIADRRRFGLMLAVSIVAAVAFFEIFFLAVGSDAYFREAFPSMPRLFVPFAEHRANIEAIAQLYTQGHYKPQFLLGEFSARGWPHYYFVAMLLKTTLPAIALIALAVFVAVRRRLLPFPVAMLLLFAALFLTAAMSGELAVGVRYVLPVYPFLYAAAAIILSGVKSRPGVIAASLLIAWHVVESVVAYPSYISYFNQLIGSHRNADRYLIDSNLDWGQDLRRLDEWCRTHGVREIAVHYFGGGDLVSDLSVRPVGGYGAGGRPLPKGWFALSRHYYRLSFSPRVSRETYDDYLARSGARFVTTVGGSINVYRVE